MFVEEQMETFLLTSDCIYSHKLRAVEAEVETVGKLRIH